MYETQFQHLREITDGRFLPWYDGTVEYGIEGDVLTVRLSDGECSSNDSVYANLNSREDLRIIGIQAEDDTLIYTVQSVKREKAVPPATTL